MNCTCSFQAAGWVRSWACLLICLALFLGGCQAKEPPLSKEAQALKKEMLKEIDKLTKALVEPVTKQDWEATKPILQKSYEEMKQAVKLVSIGIALMDQNGISQDMYPPQEKAHWDFSSYKEVKNAFDNQKIVTIKVYAKGEKVYGIIIPFLQKSKVIGAVVIGFSAKEMEEKRQISEKEFMSIDFNQ